MCAQRTRKPSRLARAAAAAGIAALALACPAAAGAAAGSSAGGPAAAAAAAGRRALLLSSTVASLPPSSALAKLALGAQPIPLAAAPPFAGGPDDVTAAITTINGDYLKRHVAYERLFWDTKMAIAGPNVTSEALAAAKTNYDAFMGSKSELDAVRALLARKDLSASQRLVLETMRRTFALYTLETPSQEALKAELNRREADLGGRRDAMQLGMRDPAKNGTFVPMSSVQLRNTMRVSGDEATRKACYEGVRAVGPFVASGLVEIVKLRNALARAKGYEDYYDFKTQASEQARRNCRRCRGGEGEGGEQGYFCLHRARARPLTGRGLYSVSNNAAVFFSFPFRNQPTQPPHQKQRKPTPPTTDDQGQAV